MVKCWTTNPCLYIFNDSSREITRMKQAKGTNGMSGEAGDEEDFKVVPVESISEYWTLQSLFLEATEFKAHLCLNWLNLVCQLPVLRDLCGVCRPGKKARILDAEGLALGSQIATSKKRARDLMDGSFHRWVSPFRSSATDLIKITILSISIGDVWAVTQLLDPSAGLPAQSSHGRYLNGSCKTSRNTGGSRCRSPGRWWRSIKKSGRRSTHGPSNEWLRPKPGRSAG